jgi:signal transduction histidine kinase/DNA-binding NarL/FixJ family response regulator
MTTHTPSTDHELLQMLRAIGHMSLAKLDPKAVLIQLGHILQPLLPHDFIDLIWINGQGYSRPLLGMVPSSHVVNQWPMSEAVQKGTALLIDTAPETAHPEPESDITAPYSQLLIPLRVSNETIGVLALGSTTPHAFSPAQCDLAEVLADHIALMVQIVSLLHHQRQERERLEALTHIRHAMACSLNVDEVFDTFAAQMAQLVPHEAISVTLLSEDGRSLERFALATVTHIAPRAGERQQLDETVAGLAVRSGQSVWTNDMAADERFRGANDRRWIAEGFRSFISSPLRVKGRIIGTLNVLTREPGCYSEADVAAVEHVADAIAIFLSNMYLHAQIRRVAVAEERNRLAREIHDTLAQSLTSIVLHLDAAERSCSGERLRVSLQQVREMARRALTEARRSVWDLRPSRLEEQPLPQAVRDELDAWQQTSGVPTRLFVRGEGVLPLAVEVAILRILQEALHNAHKYAHASEVRVELEYGTHEVRLLVSDDGVGFDPQQQSTDISATSSGLGISTMRERAHAAGGQLTIRSWPGNGTRIEASFPHGISQETAALPTTAHSASPTARVLVVDDHALVRQGLVELIKHIEGLSVVGEASDGYTALKAVQQLHPDLVLMDMRLSGIDGAATAKQLLAEQPNLQVIMLTVSDARDDVVRAIEAGARGYLLKEAPVEQLAETIRAVLRGEAVIERRITHHLVERFNHLLRDRPHSDVLSERELEVLRLIVEGRRNREIARLLVLSEHTVKSHISNIFQKLGVTDRAGAISAAVQHNLYGLSINHSPSSAQQGQYR